MKTWHVDIFVSEDGDLTKARAVLAGDRPEVLTATAEAHRNPHDPGVPEIGDEMAVGRALGGLSDKLMTLAARDVDASAGDSFRAG